MYLFEWGMHWGKGQSSYEERAEQARNRQRKPGQEILDNPSSVKESVSSRVTDNHSLYRHNATFIDLRTPNDEKRGLITLTIGGIGMTLLYGLIGAVYLVSRDFVAGHAGTGEPLETINYFLDWTFPAIPAVALYFYFRYAFPHLRLEAFTARRLIIRFNRITRKVYLLRPRHIGGTLIMDWDKIQIVIDKGMSELDGTGGFVILGWDKEGGTDLQGRPTEDVELIFVGKPTRNASELLAFWEYIRRYMEVGPEAAPRPARLISKFPWPWNSLKAAWRLDSSFLHNPALWVFVLINLMLLPVILIHATGHWISLLLCYEPRFPRAIEQAGLRRGSADAQDRPRR